MTMTTQTISEIVAEKFNFSVDKFPLSGPDNMKTPFYGLFRSDTLEVVHDASVTVRYIPHTTDDVVALTEAAQTVFEGEHSVKCHFRKGHYVNVSPDKKHRREIFANDGVFPQLMIRAGYDGKAYSGSLGIYRDACKNLMMLRTVRMTSFSIRHTSGLRSKMDELIADFSSLQAGWENLVTAMVEMENRPVRLASFLDSIYGTPEHGAAQREITIHKNRTEAIVQRLMRESAALGRSTNIETVTGWQAFNAVQGYVQHDASRSKKSTPFDRIIQATNDPIVRKAEQLVLSA